MYKITFKLIDGTQTIVTASDNQSLMEVAVASGIEAIKAECGGACSCGTCHCYVDDEWFVRAGTPEEMESQLLEFVMDPKSNSRLSCQIKITEALDGLVVQLPESQV